MRFDFTVIPCRCGDDVATDRRNEQTALRERAEAEGISMQEAARRAVCEFVARGSHRDPAPVLGGRASDRGSPRGARSTRAVNEPVEYLDLDDVLDLAERLLGTPVPIRDVGLLGSAVARPGGRRSAARTPTRTCGRRPPHCCSPSSATTRSLTETSDSAGCRRQCSWSSTASRSRLRATTMSTSSSWWWRPRTSQWTSWPNDFVSSFAPDSDGSGSPDPSLDHSAHHGVLRSSPWSSRVGLSDRWCN